MVERAIELLLRFVSLVVALCVSCFAFRVSRFLFHFGICGKNFSRYAYVFLVSLWHLTMIRSCTRWDFFFKMVCKMCKKMVCKDGAAHAVQDGVQDVMQDDWSA